MILVLHKKRRSLYSSIPKAPCEYRNKVSYVDYIFRRLGSMLNHFSLRRVNDATVSGNCA